MDKTSKSIDNKHSGDIRFSCANCLMGFKFSYNDIFLTKLGDIEFVPEPSCPRCGSTVDLVFTNSSQNKIERMLTNREIRQT